jgi:hypothetical protein
VQALLSQAGFPASSLNSAGDPGGSGAARVAAHQWEDFLRHWSATLQLLRCIAPMWDSEDPYLVSGFHVDRQSATNVSLWKAL